MEIQTRLESYGYNVVGIASSGEEAMKKAEEDQPDLVLMDIVLKGNMDGIEAADQISSLFEVPVVYLTAYADESTLHRAKVTGPFGYIIKPFEEKELYTNIEIALYRHRMEKKLKESEQWLTAAIKSIGEAVIATDIDGNIKIMNPFAEVLTGWKQEEALGIHLSKIFHVFNDMTGEEVEDPVSKATRVGIFYGLADNSVLVNKNGAKIPIDIIGSAIKDCRGNTFGIVLTFYDTIERKKMEDSLQNSATIQAAKSKKKILSKIKQLMP